MYFRVKLFTLLILTLFCACSSANMQTQSNVAQANQTDNKFEVIQEKPLTEPLNIRGEFPESLRKKWQEFTANGQYRLAQVSDMKFSEAAKQSLPGKGVAGFPYAYSWGDLNYPKRIEDDHLAAIVVDTTKNDSGKFSLVIFSPIKDRKDEYAINWLYRERDLSASTINRASGELYFSQYFDDGSRKACSVKWNAKLKQFNCGQ